MSVNVNFNGSNYSVPTAGEKGWSALTNYLVAIASGTVTMSDFKQNVREDSDVSITVLSEDSIVKLMNATDDLNITLPVGSNGKILTLIDKGVDAREITVTDVGAIQSYKSVLFLLSNGFTWELLYRVDYFDVDVSEAYSLVQRDENGLVVSAQRVDAVKLPSGSTLERPTTPEGSMLRFNTDTNKLEVYNGSVWANLEVSTGTVTELKDLSDVEATLSPSLNDLLKFDGSKWNASTYPVIPNSIGDLSDVVTAGVTNGQVLAYNDVSGSFEPSSVSSGAVDSVNGETGVVSLDLDDIPDGALYKRVSSADKALLDNVIASVAKGDLVVGSGAAQDTLPVGTNGYVLTADSAEVTGLKWSAAGAGGGSLASLSDVTITTPSLGESLEYDGAGWVNTAVKTAITSLFTAGDNIAVGDLVGISANDTVTPYTGGTASSIGSYGTADTLVACADNNFIDMVQLSDTACAVAYVDALNSNRLSVALVEVTGTVVSVTTNTIISTQSCKSPKLSVMSSAATIYYVGLVYGDDTNFENIAQLVTINTGTGTVSAGSANTINSYIGAPTGHTDVVALSPTMLICVVDNASGSPSIITLDCDWGTGAVVKLFENTTIVGTYTRVAMCRIGLSDILLVAHLSPTAGSICTVNTLSGEMSFSSLTPLLQSTSARVPVCSTQYIGLNEGRATVALQDINENKTYVLSVGWKYSRNLLILDTQEIAGVCNHYCASVINLSATNAVLFLTDTSTHNYAYPIKIDDTGLLTIGTPTDPAGSDIGAAIGCPLTSSSFFQFYTGDINYATFTEGTVFNGQFVAASTATVGNPVIVTILGENIYLSGLTAGKAYYNNGSGVLAETGTDRAFVGTAKNSNTLIVGR